MEAHGSSSLCSSGASPPQPQLTCGVHARARARVPVHLAGSRLGGVGRLPLIGRACDAPAVLRRLDLGPLRAAHRLHRPGGARGGGGHDELCVGLVRARREIPRSPMLTHELPCSPRFMPVIGLSASTASLVGNHLGADQPDDARRLLWTCVVIDLALWALTSVAVFSLRHRIAELLTSDMAIQALIAPCLSIYCFAGFADSAQVRPPTISPHLLASPRISPLHDLPSTWLR